MALVVVIASPAYVVLCNLWRSLPLAVPEGTCSFFFQVLLESQRVGMCQLVYNLFANN